MECKFQIFQITGSEMGYTDSENLLFSANMSEGTEIQDSKFIPHIDLLTGTYRLYSVQGYVLSFKICFFEDGSSTEAGSSTGQVDNTCDHDSVGYYVEFSMPASASYISLTFYDIQTNDYDLVVSLYQLLAPQIVILGAWSDFGSVVSPLLIGDTITNDTSSSYNIKLYMSGTTELALESLTPGTYCRINMGTKIYNFVIVDGGRIEPKTGTTFCYHSYNVQELICGTREIYTRSAFFSFNRYTVPSFFERLFALSESDMKLALSLEDDYATLLANWQSPDYQVASNILLDNMIKVGQNNGIRFKARINTSNKLEFYAKSLHGTSIIQTINGTKIGDTKSFLGANYASKVIAKIENMTSDDEQWYPESDFVFGGLAEPDNDEFEAASEDNIVWVLPFKIRSASAFRAIGGGYCYHDEVYGQSGIIKDALGNIITPPLVYDTYLNNPTGVPVDIHIVEYNEWRLMDPDDTDGATYHQGNTVYYFRDDNKIYNLKVVTGIADGASGHFSSSPTYYEYINNEWVPTYQTLYPALNYYVIKANLYLDGVVKLENNLGTNRVTIYNQEENLVAGKSLLRNMQSYIDSMQNQERQLTYEFNDIDDVPESGDIYEGMVISNVALQVAFDKIKATLTLSDELVKKSEYLSADGGLVLPPINSDKAYNRHSNYTSNIWLCRTQALAVALIANNGADKYLQPGFMTYAFNAFSNSRSIKGKMPAEILLQTGEVENDVFYSAMDAATKLINETLLVSWQTRSNLSVGNFCQRIGGSVANYHYYPVAFIGSSGISKHFKYKLLSDSVRGREANFPAISPATFINSQALVTVDDQEHYHDPAEVELGLLQINFKTLNSADKLYQKLIEESSLMNDTLYQNDYYLRYVKIGSTSYAVLSSNITKVAEGLYKVLVVFESLQAVPLTIGSSYDAEFIRTHINTQASEKMLEMNCVLESYGSPNVALVIYVATTK